MGHDDILPAIQGILEAREATERLLDLGCGDAELPSRYLPSTTITEYHGVDLAEHPLALARERLSGLPLDTKLHLADQAQFARSTNERYDVVVLGFALHHNLREEKRRLLASARKLLRSGGDLIVYDTFLPSGIDRDRYLESYLGWVRQDWTQFTLDEYDLIEAHIRGNDFPDTVATHLQLGREVGFTTAKVRLTLPDGFHHLLQFAG